MCSCCLMSISSAGNKICGKIQCRAVSTFLGHLAPLFYYLCSHTILAQLFLIFFGSFLFNVMALPMFWASQCFPVFMFLYKRLYYVGAQNGIIVESWYTLALLDAFATESAPEKFQRISLCSENQKENTLSLNLFLFVITMPRPFVKRENVAPKKFWTVLFHFHATVEVLFQVAVAHRIVTLRL